MSDMVTIPREVLEKIQWRGDNGDLVEYCPICDSWISKGHDKDCPISIALGPKAETSNPPAEPVQHEMEKTKEHKDIQAHYDVMNRLSPSMPYDIDYMIRYRYWYPQGPEARHVLEERGW